MMHFIISPHTTLKKAMGNPPPLKHHDYCSSSSVSSETASSPSSEPSTSSPSVSSRSSSFCGGTMLTSVSRSEEHTSELQSRFDLVCRLLLEKKKYDRLKVHYHSP